MRNRSSLSVLIIFEIVAFIVLCVLVVVAIAKPKDKEAQTYTTRVSTEEMTFDTEAATELATEEEKAEVNPQTEDFSPAVEAVLDDMSVEDKVAQLFVLSPEQLTGQEDVDVAGDLTRAALYSYHIGGLVYTYSNYTDSEQFSNLLNGSLDMAGELMDYPPFIMAELGGDGILEGDSDSFVVYTYGQGAEPVIDVLSGLVETLDDETADTLSREDIETAIDTVSTGLIANEDEETSVMGIMADAASYQTSSEGTSLVMWNEAADSIAAFRQDKDYHGVIAVSAVESADEATEMLTQGADMIYMSDDFENLYSGILAAVDEETLSEDDLDRAVGRILTLKLDMSGEDLGETAGEAADDLTETDDNGSVGDGASEMPTTQQQTTTEAAATRATTQQATTQQVTTTQSATTRATTTQQVTTTQEEITEAPATEAPAPQIGDAINMEE